MGEKSEKRENWAKGAGTGKESKTSYIDEYARAKSCYSTVKPH